MSWFVRSDLRLRGADVAFRIGFVQLRGGDDFIKGVGLAVQIDVAALLPFALQDFESFENDQTSNDGIGRCNGWNNVPCHGWGYKGRLIFKANVFAI